MVQGADMSRSPNRKRWHLIWRRPGPTPQERAWGLRLRLMEADRAFLNAHPDEFSTFHKLTLEQAKRAHPDQSPTFEKFVSMFGNTAGEPGPELERYLRVREGLLGDLDQAESERAAWEQKRKWTRRVFLGCGVVVASVAIHLAILYYPRLELHTVAELISTWRPAAWMAWRWTYSIVLILAGTLLFDGGWALAEEVNMVLGTGIGLAGLYLAYLGSQVVGFPIAALVFVAASLIVAYVCTQ